MKVLKKVKNIKGFTLAETLMAVIILLLVSVIVATGMPAVKNAYDKIVIGANAQVMLSTAVTALRDEIGTAWSISNKASNELEYFNADTGARSILCLDNEGTAKSIAIKKYNKVDFIHDVDEAQSISPIEGAQYHLVPDEASALYVTYGNGSNGIEYDAANGIVTVYNLRVCRKSDDKVMADLGSDSNTLKIKVLSADS